MFLSSDLHETYTIYSSHEMLLAYTFWGQKVEGQGHRGQICIFRVRSITPDPFNWFPSYLAQILHNTIWCVMILNFLKILKFGIFTEFSLFGSHVSEVNYALSCPEHNFISIIWFGIFTEFWLFMQCVSEVKYVLSCPEHNFRSVQPIPFIFGTDNTQYHMMCHDFEFFENFEFWNFHRIFIIQVI